MIILMFKGALTVFLVVMAFKAMCSPPDLDGW